MTTNSNLDTHATALLREQSYFTLPQYKDWTLDNPQSQDCRQKRKMSRKSHKMSQQHRKNGSKVTFSVGSSSAD